MLSTKLFSHDNNVVTALFNHQYCYNLLNKLSNNDNKFVTVNVTSYFLVIVTFIRNYSYFPDDVTVTCN